MTLTRTGLLFTALLSISSAYSAESNVQALQDPIPAKIIIGELKVVAKDFLQLPQTQDVTPEGANRAFARIQYLMPIGDGSHRMVVNDLRGLLYITDESGREAEVYLDVREQDVGFDDSMFANETGLAGFAFHPEFSQVGKPGYGKFYTAFSSTSTLAIASYLDDAAENHESVIREWSTNSPSANIFNGSSRELFRIGQFAQNHNIGTLRFNQTAAPGSEDYGLLYISIGDGGGAHDPSNYGQSLSEPMAGIMRIDPLGSSDGRSYGIPESNPFVTNSAIAPEIWAYGLRHSQHFSFDIDGRMFIADIGQNQIEEINIGVAGANYGWRLREGMFATAFGTLNARPGPVYPLPATDPEEFVYPVAQFDHDEGNAVGSGFVYRGKAIPELQGKYLFADLVTARIFYIDTDNLIPGEPVEITELQVIVENNSAGLLDAGGFPNTYSSGNRADLRLGIDAQGELYTLTKGDGKIRKLVPAD